MPNGRNIIVVTAAVGAAADEKSCAVSHHSASPPIVHQRTAMSRGITSVSRPARRYPSIARYSMIGGSIHTAGAAARAAFISAGDSPRL